MPLFQEIGGGFDSNELKLRFVEENRGGRRFKFEDEVEVRSRVMVGNEGEDEIVEFGR